MAMNTARKDCPCDLCMTGWASLSTMGSSSCHETCIPYKQYLRSLQEPEVPTEQHGTPSSSSTFRSVSREQVEKVWPGCEACKDASLAIGEVQLYGTFEGHIDVSGNLHYCPNCGRPITPVAKERQVERLEALKDDSTTD